MQLQWSEGTVNVPDLFLVGAAKCGTTSVAHQLLSHPQVFLPVAKKEPHYFSFADHAPAYTDASFATTIVWKRKDYVGLYAKAEPGKRLADCSTSYLYRHSTAIPHLLQSYGDRAKDLRVSCVLRDPVERAYSHWLYLVRNGHETLSFDEAIQPANIERRRGQRWGFDYRNYGLYADAVAAYKGAFPHFKVFLFEELKDPQRMWDELCTFNGLDRTPVRTVQANPGGVPKSKWLVRMLRRGKWLRQLSHLAPDSMRTAMRSGRDKMMKQALERPAMSAAARAELNAFYRADVDRLSAIIGRDLSHWCKA
jgi:Sulfotransferase domain